MKRHLSHFTLTWAFGFSMFASSLAPAARAQAVPNRLTILVTQGEGASVSIGQKPAQDPVVRIEDEDHRPVNGAAVLFALPVSGPSGEFLNGAKDLTVVTGSDGVAVARGIRVNDVPGKLQIYVNVAYRGLRARGLITQMVVAPPGSRPRPVEVRAAKTGGKWKWVVLGLGAAAGGGAGYYYATHKSSSPVSISTGAVSFGSPR